MPAKILSVLTAIIFVSFSNSASAAPQILGLVASIEPIPLTCTDGVCKAEVTTVCLQEHRVAPMPGRGYTAGKGTEITMMIRDKSGAEKAIPFADKIKITARRHYTSVVLSVPENVLKQYGEGGASISVAALASAVPIPNNADKKPLTAFEIEQYTGPLRDVAKNVFDKDAIAVETTRRLNQVINRLPDNFANDEAEFEKSWSKVANNKSSKISPKAKAAAAQIANTCRHEFRVGKYITMRSCMEQHHDVLASETNKKVWDAMKVGG